MDFDVNGALGQDAARTYTLCGLKAYVQLGINLRTGSPRKCRVEVSQSMAVQTSGRTVPLRDRLGVNLQFLTVILGCSTAKTIGEMAFATLLVVLLPISGRLTR